MEGRREKGRGEKERREMEGRKEEGGQTGRTDATKDLCVLLSQAPWKAGKRRAEKDELVAGAFLSTIELPDVTVDLQSA